MDSITVLKKMGCNAPQPMHGKHCRVVLHREPHAETEDKESIEFPSMKRHTYTQTMEWAANSIELRDSSHMFHWGRKRNGKSGDKWSKDHVRIATPEAATAIDDARKALEAAREAYFAALWDAWSSGQTITKAKAMRLVKEWPEATHEVYEDAAE